MLQCENSDEVTRKPPPDYRKKEKKYEVPFFSEHVSAPSASTDRNDVVIPMDNIFFTNLVAPPKIYDETFQYGNPFAELQTTAAPSINYSWQQRLFECWKTEPKFLLLAVFCPDIADYMNDSKLNNLQQSTATTTTPEGKQDKAVLFFTISQIFCKILNLVLFLVLCALGVHVWPIAVFMALSLSCCCSYFLLRPPSRQDFISYFSLKSDGCCSCVIFGCCQRCNACQMHTELVYFENTMGRR